MTDPLPHNSYFNDFLKTMAAEPAGALPGQVVEEEEDPKLTAEKSSPNVLPNETKELERVFRHVFCRFLCPPALVKYYCLAAESFACGGDASQQGKRVLVFKMAG